MTDEERREIAKNLRFMCANGCRYAEQFYELLNETVMDEWDFYGFQDVADRLADLIEPSSERACRIGGTDHEHEDGVGCDACGKRFRRPWEPFRYCPCCGARVAEGGAR